MMGTFAQLAFRNLLRNKRRSLSTGLAIAAGFAAFMLAAGYAYRVHNVLSSYTIYGMRVGHLGIYKKNALDMYSIKPKQYSLSISEQEAIRTPLKSLDFVEYYGRYFSGQGLAGNGCKTFPFIGTGIDLSIEEKIMNHPTFLRWNHHIVKSRVGQNIWDFPVDFGAVGLSEGLASLLGKTKLHQEFKDSKLVLVTDCSAPDVKSKFAEDANIQLAAGTWDGTLGAIDGEVVTKFSTGLVETNNSSVIATVDHLQKLYSTENITNFSVWLKDGKDLPEALTTLRSKLGPMGFDVIPWTDERLSPYYTGTMQFIYVMVGFIGCVLALVVILSIFNSATMTIIERSQEVGMFRSVGYTRRYLRIMFVIEGFYLTVFSVLLGAVIGLVAMYTINSLELMIYPPGVAQGLLLVFAPNALIVITGAICVSILGIGSTWIAVAGVVRKNIANLVSGPSR